jgi:malate dehydrogenase (oxaloacetate-decarboxylating)(NADP+)
MLDKQLRQSALDYHALPAPGKTAIAVTKPSNNQADLSLAYTPGVAEPVREIAVDAANAYKYTNKGNLVAVISNGTAVLGLGNVGAIASKPVMEGKAVLFKCLADIDVFDIEIDCNDPTAFIETVVRIAPTFGGINLEDIKAPECFAIEQELVRRLAIPVMHDDQHGTAIVVAAALLNALEVQHKKLDAVTIACVGAGAAGIAIAELLVQLGAQQEQIVMVDSKGVINTQRTDLNQYKQRFAIATPKNSLAEAINGADVFIGVSGPGILLPEMLKTMAYKPIVFALSNPVPEILPELALQLRQDIVMATGRSDYANQVNNALVFPYIFRGALAGKADKISQAMKIAAVHSLKDLAKEPVPAAVMQAYPNSTSLVFGKDYILPKMLDPRLKEVVTRAVMAAITQS